MSGDDMKRKHTLMKDFFREVRASRNRFLSIMAIVILGVAFFSGVRAACPDMKLSADTYYDDVNLMDIRVLSTLGLTDEDVDALEQIRGIKAVDPAYSADVLCQMANSQPVLHLMSYTKDMNQLTIEEGRIPEKADEIFMDQKFMESVNLQIGDTVLLDSGEEDKSLEDTLLLNEYTIVGTGTSPFYLSLDRGTSTIGNGSVSGFGILLPEAFTLDVYTEIYLTVDEAETYICYDDDYEDLVDEVKDRIQGIEDEQCEIRYAKIKADGQEDIDAAKQEIADARKKLKDAREELEDGKKQLQDGKEEIQEKKQELQDGKDELAKQQKELESGKSQLSTAWSQLDSQRQTLKQNEARLANVRQQLAQKEQELLAGEEQLAQGDARIAAGEEQLALAKEQLEQSETLLQEKAAEVEQAREMLPQLEQSLEEVNQRLGEFLEQVDQQMELPDPEDEDQQPTLEELQESKTQLETAIAQAKQGIEAYEQGLLQIEAGKQELAVQEEELLQAKEQAEQSRAVLAAGRVQLEDGKAQLAAGEQQIALGKAQLAQAEKTLQSKQNQLKEGEKELDKARKTIKSGEASLKEAEETLQEKEKELQDAEEEFIKESEKAEKEIAEGEDEIAEAQEKLDELEKPVWYILGRNSLQTYVGYGQDAERIGAIGEVFPAIFFLVAALICLTTMTRMVEENRTQIGMLKALGYGKAAIAAKYLCYAFFASCVGSLIGIFAGQKTLPVIIIQAYKILYNNLPVVQAPMYLGYSVSSALLATGITVLAAGFSCWNELRAVPAELMRPEAPKKGKRIFLEHLPFIWKRLSFSYKAILRNLFRYKKRFFMTVLGIGGCMGLLMVGFGLKDSIMAIGEKQFGEIRVYSSALNLNSDITEEERESLFHYLDQDEDVLSYMEGKETSVDVEVGEEERSVYLVVVPDKEKFRQFVRLKDRITQEEYQLDDQGVVLSEKLAKVLGVSEGDTIYLKDGETKKIETVVSHVVENYYFHYVYMSEQVYRQIYQKDPEYTEIFTINRTNEEAFEEEFQKEYMKLDGVMNITLLSTMEGRIADLIRSMDAIIYVIVIAAGLLAFVVLYNLNNINISERRRELSTLKVLGFFDGEVSAYVFRENIILTLLGALTGIGFGLALHRFVILTAEIDLMMFGREIKKISYLYSICLTILFSVLVNLFMHFRLKKLDMVESMKSVE